MAGVTFKPVGDTALLVGLGQEISDDLSARVQMLDRLIHAAHISGILETVPAFVNVLIQFDPLVTDHMAVQQAVSPLLDLKDDQDFVPTQHVVPVCYDTEFAPDLGAVAKAVGLSEEAVIAMHSSACLKVGMYGFAPGYAYLSGVPEDIQVPRKPTPVRDVAAGSVLIAGPQCLVTTLKMPTGWSIIGRSAQQVLTGDPDRPFLFDVGDEVTFQRIDRATYETQLIGRPA